MEKYNKLFDEYEYILDNVIVYLNYIKNEHDKDILFSLKKTNKIWIEKLTKILLELDNIKNNNDIRYRKKQLIIEIQNILDQLDTLFTNNLNNTNMIKLYNNNINININNDKDNEIIMCKNPGNNNY